MAATAEIAVIFEKNLKFLFQIKVMSINAWNFYNTYKKYICSTYLPNFSFWPPSGRARASREREISLILRSRQSIALLYSN